MMFMHLALARGEATAVVLLNKLAVFDTNDHGTLLDCLGSWFGIGGVFLDWFNSYLSDCSLCIKIGSILFDAEKLLFAYLRALSLVQYSFPYILLPSAKSLYRFLLLCR